MAEHTVIGVAVDTADLAVAREFFELFKTPWEVAVPGRRYAIVLSTTGRYEGFDSPVVLAYGSGQQPLDEERQVSIESRHSGDVVWGDLQIPIYGRLASFEGETRALTVHGKSIQYEARLSTRVVWRIGFDLFREVRHLLTVGQPATRALIPTLERHIELLRRLLIEAGVPFLEIPPRPAGYDFICCLTHDIDFYGIRRQGMDRTVAGFLLRASIGTVVDLARSRRTLRDALRNLAAVCSLPLVFAGLIRDFWRPFDDYASVEDPKRSTFFLVPFKGRPGQSPAGPTDATRAVAYQASDIAEDVSAAAARGSEIGLHGIDAWCDPEAGRAEMREIASITGRRTTGVRMHWLYFSERTPQLLEEAAFDYDSTWGYNEAVGYRAGTSQVFRFPGTDHLMELPMSIMDSALLSSGRMALASSEAIRQCDVILDNAKRLGGTVVVNWHCRSLAPERLWREPYRMLLDGLSRERAWLARGADAVNWFEWRRSIRFVESADDGSVRIEAPMPSPSGKGGLIRIHRPAQRMQEIPFDGPKTYTACLETERSETFI